MSNTAFKFPDEDGDVVDIDDEAGTAADKSGGIETDVFAEGGDVEVEVIDDTPAADKGRKPLAEGVEDPTDDELTGYSDAVRGRINKLTHARHDERRRADALQRERDELEQVARSTLEERDQLRAALGRGVEVFNKQALESADGALVGARTKLKAAHEAFDTDAIVAAQEELNDAQFRKATLQNKRTEPVQTEKVELQSPPTARPAAPTLDSRTQEWLGKNKWFGDSGDEAMTGFALGLHQKLVKEHGEGVTQTAEYYSQIDAAMRKTFPSSFSSGARKPGSVVAGAARSNGPRKVQLTSTQVALAKKFGMTLQQYAAEVVKTQKEN